ncbi:MAG: hypothetical protein B7Y95_18120 [Rhizobiales bacterium 32-66-11]|nr:MAG: hypothetical protein B7Y95_18120 [Rhizobiales bacterium 32-66-11]
MGKTVSRNQSQPKYRTIEDYIRSRIMSGEFAVDTLLPTEEMLCARFGVSRATVRTALSNIQADGLIVRSPAVGSRVVASTRRRNGRRHRICGGPQRGPGRGRTLERIRDRAAHLLRRNFLRRSLQRDFAPHWHGGPAHRRSH